MAHNAIDFGWKITGNIGLCFKIGDRVVPIADLSEGDEIWIGKNRTKRNKK